MEIDIVTPTPVEVNLRPGRPPNAQPAPLRLMVVQPGQTRWNLGMAETRRTLYVNGLYARFGTDYRITLPYLDYLGSVPLDVADELLLID